jgi:hypothetical protein
MRLEQVQQRAVALVEVVSRVIEQKGLRVLDGRRDCDLELEFKTPRAEQVGVDLEAMQFALAQEIRELQRVETTTPLCPTERMLVDQAPEGLHLRVGGLTLRTAAIDVGELPPLVAVLLGVGDQFAAYERAQIFEDVKRERLGPHLVGRLAHEAQGSFEVTCAQRRHRRSTIRSARCDHNTTNGEWTADAAGATLAVHRPAPQPNSSHHPPVVAHHAAADQRQKRN